MRLFYALPISAAALISLVGIGELQPAKGPDPGHIRVALLCMKSGEQVSGMQKICYYRCPTGTAAITVAAYQLCPISIDR